MAVDLNPNENVGQWLEIIGKDGTKGYRNAQTGAQITPQQFGELVAAAKNAVQSKMLDPLGPFGKQIHPSVKQLAEIDTKRIPGYKPETQVLMDAPMLPGVGAGMRALAGAAQRALPSQAAQRALPNPGNVAEVIGAPTFRESFRAQQAAGRVGPRAPFREADVVGPSQLRSPVANPQLPSSTASPQLPAPSSVLPNAPLPPPGKVGVPPSFAAGAAGMTMAANAAQQFANNQNAAQVPVANPAEFVRNWSDPELNPTLLSFMSKVGTPSNWSDPKLNPTLLSFMSKVGTPSNTASKGQNAPKGRQVQRLESMRALTQAVSQGAAEQPGAPAPTDTSVVPNTPSGRPDYKYYADMLNAADSNDSYYRDFLNLRNQARAAAREAAASNMRYQFVPIRDDRANRIYFVNADGSDVVLDMGKPEDVREYRRVAEKIGVDINHLSDWMDRSSKPLARYNMPPGSNVDTTPDFGFWRKLPSTKAEGAEPAMDTPSTPTNLGLSLGERNLPRSAKMPSPQSTLETMQRMRDLRMPLGGFPAAQTPEPATPAAPAPSAPVAQTKQAEPAKSAEEQGTKMQQPAVAAVAPQSQQFTPRAAAAPRPAGESTRMMEMRREPRMGEMDPSMPSETLERTETPTPLEWQRMLPLVKTRKSTYPRRDFVPDLYDGEEQLPDWLSNLSVAQNVIGESIFKGLRKDSMYKDIPVSKPNVRHLESDLPAEPPLPPVEQGQVGAPVVLTPSNMPRVNPEDEDMSRFRQYRNFIPR